MENTSLEEIKESLLQAGFSREELSLEIEKKRREFKDYISDKGILFLIAKEQGFSLRSPDVDPSLYDLMAEEMDYDEFKINIDEISEGMVNIVLAGRIGKINPVHFFTKKDETTGKVSSFLLKDNSGIIKVILWGDKADIINNELFDLNRLVRVIGGYAKLNNEYLEVHVGRKSKIMFLSEEEDSAKKIPLMKKPIEEMGHKLPSLPLTRLLDEKKFLSRLQGTVKILDLKEFNKKSGEKSFLLKFKLLVDGNEILINAWGLDAIESLRVLQNGEKVSLTNLSIRKDSYSDKKELHFTKNTTITPL